MGLVDTLATVVAVPHGEAFPRMKGQIMQRIVLALAFLCATPPGIIFGQDVIVHARRVNITSAQQDAEIMARSGVLRHCGTAGGRREGIGFSTSSAQQAVESSCFYRDAMRGRYRIVEKGVARGPRGWFAVIRYE